MAEYDPDGVRAKMNLWTVLLVNGVRITSLGGLKDHPLGSEIETIQLSVGNRKGDQQDIMLEPREDRNLLQQLINAMAAQGDEIALLISKFLREKFPPT
jgi:hypothetical protein